jgi:hypothetical protein
MKMLGRSSRQAILALALVLLLPGCEDSLPPSTQWTVTSDTLSSGAIHAVNVPPARDPGPTWVLEEELRIGSLDGDGPSSFGQLKGVAVSEDGRVIVLDAIAQELRVFGADGRHLATYGGKGGGPGELESAYGLMMSSEGTVWVPDHRNARMSLFDPDVGIVASYPLHVFSRAFVWQGVLDSGGRVLKPSITPGPPRRRVLRVYTPEMVLADSLPMPDRPATDPRDPPDAFYWEAPDGRSSGYIAVPFYPQGNELVDPNGAVWSTAPGDPTYRVTRWNPGGDTTLVLDTRRAQVPVPAGVRDSIIGAIREQLLERGATNQDWSKVPEVRPAVESMFLAEEGHLWIRVASPDSITRYDVFDRDGRYSGTAVTALRVFRWVKPVVRGEHFWAVVTDDLDVPFVVRARVQPVDPGGNDGPG